MGRLVTTCVAASIACNAGIAHGDFGDQLLKLVAGDGEEGDRLGSSVAISNGLVVAGAAQDDDNGFNAGAAYVFDATTGRQLHKLVADDAAEADLFGTSVSIDGSFIVVGAPNSDAAGDNAGSAYVFDATTGTQLRQLVANDAAPGDGLGDSVAMSGTIAVVGAADDDDGGNNAGSAYLFDVTTGQQLHKLTATDAAPLQSFGLRVAISGNVAIVGATGDSSGGDYAGAAYVFDVTSGEQLHKLTAEDAAAFDHFGRSVSIGNDVVVVGAYLDDDGATNSGSAYTFEVTSGEQLHKLTAAAPAEQDRFGGSVSIGGSLVVVGASQFMAGGTGTAYVFDAASGDQLAQLVAEDAASGDNFGVSVSISDDIAIVGAPFDDDGASATDSAYLFDAALCPADLDDNGIVDVGDLVAVILAWGTPAGDVTGDGTTDVSDLVAVITSWGECA